MDKMMEIRYHLDNRIEEFVQTYPPIEKVQKNNDALAGYDYWGNEAIGLFKDFKIMVEDVFYCMRCQNATAWGK